MILEGKTILVSGVGPGLGREVASRVLRDGGNVVVGARKAESLESTAKELDPSGARILAHSFDITDEEACRGIVAAAEERFGRLDGIAQVAAAEVQAVCVTGGTARVPRILAALETRFGAARLRHARSFHSVIQGLARRARAMAARDPA